MELKTIINFIRKANVTIDKVVWNRWLPHRNLALVSSVKMACVCNQRNGYYYSGIPVRHAFTIEMGTIYHFLPDIFLINSIIISRHT